VSAAYADLLGDEDPTGSGFGQRAMISSLIPRIYERVWRPLLSPLLMAGRRDERAMALRMLGLAPGDSVLDVGCGPGNFTRAFARASPDGLVVGLDASRTMLDQAVREPNPPNVRYVRADAAALPFPDETFDAVCCFAALYFIERPLDAIDEMVRVLAPGGRIALLASVSRGPLPAGVADAVIRRATGTRIFGRDALTRALAERGLTEVDQRVAGLAQFVSARRHTS
jgi:ubiquinone/menaquinone biosynthesis C-methylase UbiE